jgi:hypothetical protein
MKKFLLIVGLAFTVFAANAQKGPAVKLPLTVGDTILNTTTVAKVIPITGGYNGVSIQVVLASQTGTPAGSVKLYGSNDGGTSYDQILATASDTLAISASALHYTFKVTNPVPSKLKVVAVGTGTQHTLVKVWYRTPVFQNN